MSTTKLLQVTRHTGTLIHATPDESAARVEMAVDYGQVLRHAKPLSNARGGWWQLPNGYVRASDVRVMPDAAVRVSAMNDAQPLTIEPLSQRDPRWGHLLLGNTTLSSITLHDFGCLLVCYTMLVNSVLERKITPDQHNEIRRANGHFAAPGPWGGMATSFDVSKETNGRIKISWISERTERSAASAETVRRLLDHLALKQPAIIEVDFFPDDGSAEPKIIRQPGKQMHFVIAIGVEANPNGGEALIKTIDPYDGQYKTLSPRFGNSNAFAITRVATYDVNGGALVAPVPTPSVGASAQVVPALGACVLWHPKAAQEALSRGCKWFTVVNNPVLARDLAGRGAQVLVRHIWGTSVPSVEAYFEKMGELIPGAIYLGLNENEALHDTPADIRKRADFDVKIAQEVQKRSGGRSIYAGGGFAMNRPDFEHPAVCEAIEDGYAEAYNSKLMLLDLHCYLPAITGDKAIDGLAGKNQYLRYWEHLFHRCGFDPKVRGLLCSETGIDLNGAGFIQNRVSNADFSTWAKTWTEVQMATLTIDNKRDALVRSGKVMPSRFSGGYASPLLGGALFQLSPPEAGEWREHNLYLYLNELAALWKQHAQLAPERQPKVAFAATAVRAGNTPLHRSEDIHG
jgi:hypothetical protein